ncbi:hypothetical protein KYG_12844 [Acidovorax sp. NO-1]|nr:hypothetical protein KYG_12844 [Acidovorax sp. NO-1]
MCLCHRLPNDVDAFGLQPLEMRRRGPKWLGNVARTRIDRQDWSVHLRAKMNIRSAWRVPQGCHQRAMRKHRYRLADEFLKRKQGQSDALMLAVR